MKTLKEKFIELYKITEQEITLYDYENVDKEGEPKKKKGITQTICFKNYIHSLNCTCNSINNKCFNFLDDDLKLVIHNYWLYEEYGLSWEQSYKDEILPIKNSLLLKEKLENNLQLKNTKEKINKI